MKMHWHTTPETKNVAALSQSGDYIVSHRPELFTVSYRPPGQHIPVGQFPTLEAALHAAEQHAKNQPPNTPIVPKRRKRHVAPDWLGCGRVITQASWDGFLAARSAYARQDQAKGTQ